MTKVFISSDIEGVADISHWNEADKANPEYPEFREIMTKEVKTICESLPKEDSEIVVRDAHWTARNIIHKELPENVRLIRGFNGHPDCMMFGIDNSFDFTVLHGYHTGGGWVFEPISPHS